MIFFSNSIYLTLEEDLPATLDKETQDRDFNSGFANGPNLPFQSSQLPGSQRAIVFAFLLGQDCLEDQMR